MVFKGYATGTGKKATMKVKDAQLLSWDDVQGNQSFGAILNQDFVDISFDTDEVKCFYPPVGKIPKECIDFTVIDEVLIPKRSFVYSELMILTVALATLSTSDF